MLEEEVNKELVHVSEWLKANELSLNVSKSNVLVFRKKNESKARQIKLKINNCDIQEKECAKYLGLYFDNKMMFHHHINQVNVKLNKGNAILAKLRHYTSESIIRNVYHAHVESHLNYGLSVWGCASKTQMDKITTNQKKSIKIMKFVKARDHIDMPFKNTGILPVDQLRCMSTSKFIWKTNNNVTPFCKTLFEQSRAYISERDDLKYLVPFKNTLYARSSTFYRGIKEWNRLPDSIKKSKTINTFKTNLKKLLFSTLDC